MLNLFSDETRRNPYPAYAQLRGQAPLLHEPRSDLWLVFDYEGVKRVLTDHEAFSSLVAPPSSQTAQWLIFSDPPRHTKLRALLLRAFTPRAVAGLEPLIRTLSHELLEPALARGELDLVADFALPLPLMVIAGMFGAPVTDLPRFRHWSDVILTLGLSALGGEEAERAQREFRAVTAEMNTYLQALSEQRRRVPREDLLTRLVEAEVDGERLTDEELLGFFQLLLVAGHETTTNLLSNAVLCFLEHPEQLARLRAAPELLPSAIEEVLRYRSPVQAMWRVTRREVALHGQVIPPGRLVMPMIGSANRDPGVFPAADRFDITRAPNPHLAFGHGLHFCIGAPLARLEARVALPLFLERVKDFALASDAPWEPRQAIHVLGPARLPLRVEPVSRAVPA
jgi:cytochrome P450